MDIFDKLFRNQKANIGEVFYQIEKIFTLAEHSIYVF